MGGGAGHVRLLHGRQLSWRWLLKVGHRLTGQPAPCSIQEQCTSVLAATRLTQDSRKRSGRFLTLRLALAPLQPRENRR